MKKRRLLTFALLAASCAVSCTESAVDEDNEQEQEQEKEEGTEGETGGETGGETETEPEPEDEKPPVVVAQHPNLMYIFPDQYRLYALSIWQNPAYAKALSTLGDPVSTPNIDRIFEEGLVFTQATSTQPLSSPHRGMLMSGMFPEQNGVYNNCYVGREAGLHSDIECFTDVLSAAGYATAYVGKAHWEKTEPLFDINKVYVGSTTYPGGNYMNNYDTYVPIGASRHSNDYWYQHVVDSHFNPIAYSNQPQLINGKPDGTPYVAHGFSAQTEANVIIDFLRAENGERDKDKPFSVMWALNPPHPPYTNISHCDKDIYNQYYANMPLDELFVRDNVSGNFTTIAKVYFSLIKGIDEEIGRVLDELDAQGLTNNTIIVFTSDHGDMLGSQGVKGKNYIYDESFLVPFAIKYPGNIPHRTEDLLLGTVDIMPTMLGFMGLSDKIPSGVQGVNFSRELISGYFAEGKRPRSALYINIDDRGVRSDKYSYLVTAKGAYTIFNNIDDPYQMKALSFSDLPEEDVKMLKSELGRWLTKANDNWAKTKMFPDLITY